MLKVLLTLGEAEGKDTYFDIAGIAQFVGTGDDGGSRGDDIVDNQQVFVADRGSVDQLKYLLDILIPFPAAFARLTASEDVPLHHFVIYRDACQLADSLGNLQALVVASLTQAFLASGTGTIQSIPSKKLLDSNSLAVILPITSPISGWFLYFSW